MRLIRSWWGVVLPVVAGVGLGVISVGCGGSNSSGVQETASGAISEKTLTEQPGKRVSMQNLVVLDLEREGVTKPDDSDEPGSDRIPYRLPNDTRVTVSVDPADEFYVTLISSATGRLVMDVGPDNPSFDADLPAGDYDLYIHSKQTEEDSIAVFAQPEKVVTREAFGSWWKVNFGRNCAGCDMRGGYYLGNNWKGVNIEGANLTGAELSHMNMQNVRAAGANFTDAQIASLYAPDADFSRAIFRNNYFNEGDLTRARFSEASFNKVTFQFTPISGANFNHSAGEKVAILDCYVERANMDLAKWLNSNLIRSSFVRCDASDWDLTGSMIRSTTFTDSFLANMKAGKADIERLSIIRGNLTGAKWEDATVTESELDHVQMQNSNLKGIAWWNTTITVCDIFGSDLRFGRLQKLPKFSGTETSGVTF